MRRGVIRQSERHRKPSGRAWFVACVLLVAGISPPKAHAASMSSRELQVLERVITFLLPSPSSGAQLCIVYAAADPASRRDAEEIAALLGGGLKIGTATVPSILVASPAAAAGGCRLVIVAAGANGPQISAATRSAHTLCVTADTDAVQAGLCTMAIRSDPRMDIMINHTAAVAGGIEFAAAFRMMIREI
jgi:hypothetical protein